MQVKLWNSLDSLLISYRNIHQFKKQYTDKNFNSCVRVITYSRRLRNINKTNEMTVQLNANTLFSVVVEMFW